MHRGSFAEPRLDVHAAARLLGEAKHLAQSESRAFADFLGGKERLEHLGAHILAHSGPGIGHADADIFARRRLFRAKRRPEHHVLGPHGKAAADLHGVAGIDGEIEHGELELRRVDHCRPQAALQPGLDSRRAAHRALQQVAHADHGLVEIERLRLQTLSPRKRQQLVGQLGAAFRR